MEKLAMGSFFAPLRRIESVSATSLASFLRLPKFQVVSEFPRVFEEGKPPKNELFLVVMSDLCRIEM